MLINFSDKAEKINFSQNFTGFPDLITVEISSRNSTHEKGHQIKINKEFELKAFETIVALYNGSSVFSVSKIVFVLIAVCIFINLKF